MMSCFDLLFLPLQTSTLASCTDKQCQKTTKTSSPKNRKRSATLTLNVSISDNILLLTFFFSPNSQYKMSEFSTTRHRAIVVIPPPPIIKANLDGEWKLCLKSGCNKRAYVYADKTVFKHQR